MSEHASLVRALRREYNEEIPHAAAAAIERLEAELADANAKIAAVTALPTRFYDVRDNDTHEPTGALARFVFRDDLDAALTATAQARMT